MQSEMLLLIQYDTLCRCISTLLKGNKYARFDVWIHQQSEYNPL